MVARRTSKFRAAVCTNSDRPKCQRRCPVRNLSCPQTIANRIPDKNRAHCRPSFTGCAEVFRRALRNLECVRRDVKNRGVRSAAYFLAVATVTIEHHNWFRCDFITNRAAGAPTGNRFHFVNLKLMKLFDERRPWTIRQAAMVLAVPYRFADRVFAFSVSVSRSRAGALVTSDSRR